MNYQVDYIKGLTNTLCELLRGKVDNINYVTSDLIVFALNNHDSIESLMDKIKVLLKPKEIEQKDLYKYLHYMHRILSNNVITNYFYIIHFNNIDLSKTPKNLYQLMRLLKQYNESIKFNDFLGNLGIVTLIVSYIYANNINNYNLLYNFLNDPDYFYDKLTLSGIKFDYDELNELYNLPYEEIYKNIEEIFNIKKDKKIIK